MTDPGVLLAARAQFGLNIGFHILFPALTLGLGWVLVYFRLRYTASRDEAARNAVAKTVNAGDGVIEIVGNIPATSVASWGLTDGEVRLVLPGEPIVTTV